MKKEEDQEKEEKPEIEVEVQEPEVKKEEVEVDISEKKEEETISAEEFKKAQKRNEFLNRKLEKTIKEMEGIAAKLNEKPEEPEPKPVSQNEYLSRTDISQFKEENQSPLL